MFSLSSHLMMQVTYGWETLPSSANNTSNALIRNGGWMDGVHAIREVHDTGADLLQEKEHLGQYQRRDMIWY
jgi:hypothetical protein